MVSRNWGFTDYTRDDYVAWKREGRLRNDGVIAKVYTNRGSLAERAPGTIFAQAVFDCVRPLHPDSE